MWRWALSRLSDILFGLKYLFTFRFDKNALAQRLEREREIMNVVAVLPGRYTCKQVERALKASNTTPEMISLCLATGEHTYVVERFYAALRVQVERERLHVNEDEEELRAEGWNGEEVW